MGRGRTQLTARGAGLVRNFELIRQEHARFVARLNAQSRGLTQDYSLMESIAMKTSARNQFAGTVRSVRAGAVNDEIELEVIGGLRIVATVTGESRAELGLEVGAKAFALVKASAIILMTDGAGVKLSARNQLAGRVARVTPGAVNSEVVLELRGGGSVAAVITNESAQTLGLARQRGDGAVQGVERDRRRDGLSGSEPSCDVRLRALAAPASVPGAKRGFRAACGEPAERSRLASRDAHCR